MKDERRDEEAEKEEKLNREEDELRMEIIGEHVNKDHFCLSDAFNGLASTIPPVEGIMESGADRTYAEFNIAVFDQTFHGFQAILARFGCGAAGVQALKGTIDYYSLILEVAEKHEKFCEDKGSFSEYLEGKLKQDDEDKLNKML